MRKITILPLLLLFSASFLQCSNEITGSEFDSDSSGYASDDEAPSPTVISALSEMTNAIMRQQQLIDHQRKQMRDMQTEMSQLQKEREQDKRALTVLFRAVRPKVRSSPRSGRSFVTSRARMKANILFRAMQIQPYIRDGKQTEAYVSGLLKTVMREIITTKHRISALEKQTPQPAAEKVVSPATE